MVEDFYLGVLGRLQSSSQSVDLRGEFFVGLGVFGELFVGLGVFSRPFVFKQKAKAARVGTFLGSPIPACMGTTPRLGSVCEAHVEGGKLLPYQLQRSRGKLNFHWKEGNVCFV